MKTLVVIATSLCACGESSPTTVDLVDAAVPDGQLPQFSCWPPIPQVPHGSASLGTANAEGAFVEMPETLPIAYGVQAGYMLFAHARMTGMSVGNPNDILDPSNPFTRIRAYFDDTDIPLNQSAECAVRFSYKDAAGGGFELSSYQPVIFDVCWRYDDLVGARIRVELEIMDSSGHFASETKVVTGGAPLGTPGLDYPDEAGMGSGGCIQDP